YRRAGGRTRRGRRGVRGARPGAARGRCGGGVGARARGRAARGGDRRVGRARDGHRRRLAPRAPPDPHQPGRAADDRARAFASDPPAAARGALAATCGAASAMSLRAPIRSTVADVDLDAIASNFASLRARATNDVIAVVKADAYGHGAEAVGHTLVEAGAAMLAVVTVEEALVLRAAGIRAPILVFLGATDRAEAEAAIAADLVLVVWDTEAAKQLGDVAAFGLLPGINATRPGVSLYGLHTAPHLVGALALRPALEWRSRVRRVADVKRGTGVSYGHEYRMPRDGRIATVPVGYGDGLARSLGESGKLVVGGRALPVAGRICMDQVMVDVTDVPEVREGDEVVIIGAQGGARQSAD